MSGLARCRGTLAAAEAAVGVVPAYAADAIAAKATTQFVTPEAVDAREKIIRHDIMSMVQLLTDAVEAGSPGSGNFVHAGATSYCIEDNRTAMQLTEAAEIVERLLLEFGGGLKMRAVMHRDLAMMGRTHTQPAEPITLGLKFAKHLFDVILDIIMWRFVRKNYILGKPMNGAVGTAASYVQLAGKEGALKIAELVMNKLELSPALITYQIVTRKSHAFVAAALANVAMTCYRFAQECYHLGRPEIGEILPRKLDPRKVGSSAMPAKAAFPNDIEGENVMGNARVVKNLLMVALDDIPTLHERTLDNSAAERVWVPHMFMLTDECLTRCVRKLDSMVVVEGRIAENLERFSWYTFTEPLMMELVKRGVGRQEAHHKLQEYCVELRQSGESKDPVVMLSGMFNGSISSDEIRQLQKGHAGYVGMAPEFTDKVVAAFDKLATNTEDQKEKE